MLTLKILGQRILWIKRNKKKLSIIVVSLSVAYASIVVLTVYFPIETARIWSSISEEENLRNLEFEHHYLCEDKDCSICGLGLGRDPIIKWLNDNELSIILTTYIGTDGTTFKGFDVKIEDNKRLQIYTYENESADCWKSGNQISTQCSEFIVKGIERNDYKGDILQHVGGSKVLLMGPSRFEIYKEDARNKPTFSIIELKTSVFRKMALDSKMNAKICLLK